MKKTDNELIAEFMGLECRNGNEVRIIQQDWPNSFWTAPKYDTSWDWLMPVVDKIEELYKKDFDPTEWVDSVLKGEPKKGEIKYMDVITLPLASKIDEAYKNVVEFIRWYNSQNS